MWLYLRGFPRNNPPRYLMLPALSCKVLPFMLNIYIYIYCFSSTGAKSTKFPLKRSTIKPSEINSDGPSTWPGQILSFNATLTLVAAFMNACSDWLLFDDVINVNVWRHRKSGDRWFKWKSFCIRYNVLCVVTMDYIVQHCRELYFVKISIIPPIA